MQLQERRAILKRFVEEYGFDLDAVYTERKNEAKTNKKITLFKEKKRDGTNHLRIVFLCKEGWFCDSYATDLRFHGLAEYADTRSDIE